jgi:hypothetical protein
MTGGTPIKLNDSTELHSVSLSDIKSNINDIISRKIPVFRLNIENKLVTVPADKLEQFLGSAESDNTIFYMISNWKSDTVKAAPKATAVTDTPVIAVEILHEAIAKYGKATEQLERFTSMSVIMREELLDKSIEELHPLRNEKIKIDMKSIIQMVKVVADTYYSNYANFMEKKDTEYLRSNPYGVYTKSEWIVTLIIDVIRNNWEARESFRIIDNITTGSYTIDQMNKCFLWFICFCIYYNDYIDTGMISKRLRTDFKDKHLRYYKKIMPDQNLTIERIVKDGLRRIDIEKELISYSLGALLYDIGKLPFIAYHDSNDDYNENLVKMHVLTGFNMIQSTRKYEFPVAIMAALHHEYYGGTGSYQFTNPVLSKLSSKKRNDGNARFFITFDEEEFKNGFAMAFFPCKIIEIIDVFNALVNKKANSPLDALKIMKKHFIAQSLKIDPLLFEIFIDFKQSFGTITSIEREEIDTILY